MLFRLADAIQEDAERIGSLETRDNGKLYREMLIQLQLVPKWIRYFAGMADKVEGATIPLDRLSVLNYTVPEPLGVVAIITPWNSPVFLTMMAAAPALAAGNTVVVKPSEVTSASMLAVAELAAGVGFPPGVFNVITGLGDTGKALVEHPLVDKISLTGGVEAGRAVGQAAAAALHAGHARARRQVGEHRVRGRQPRRRRVRGARGDLRRRRPDVRRGIARVRPRVGLRRAGRAADRARAETIRIGNPMDPETQMGPIATKAQLEKVSSFVERARAEGGEIVAGGQAGRGAGARGRLLLAADDRRERRARLATSRRTRSSGRCSRCSRSAPRTRSLKAANSTRYGLAAGLWTRDVSRAHRVARQLEAGTVWVNMYRAMAPQSPFGGYKESGIGRQNGVDAIREYVQTKSIWVELSEEVQDPFVLRA